MDQIKSKKQRPKIGDIFEVNLRNDQKGYVQYIANDLTQLNSDVIRVFKTHYPISQEINIEDIINDEVEFYSHVTGVEFGEKDGIWIKKGNSQNLGDLRAPFFRQSRDSGNPKIKVSKNWSVWHVNEPMVDVGELKDNNTKADIGSVTWPERVVERMRTGEYPVHYPAYK